VYSAVSRVEAVPPHAARTSPAKRAIHLHQRVEPGLGLHDENRAALVGGLDRDLNNRHRALATAPASGAGRFDHRKLNAAAEKKWNDAPISVERLMVEVNRALDPDTGKYIGCSLGSPAIDNVALAKGDGVEGERVEDPEKLQSPLAPCRRAVGEGRPYLLDVRVERLFGGADSSWYDYFSVAKNQPRVS